jgi:hypothetical protein
MIDANGTVFVFEHRLRFFNFRPLREERALLYQFVRELKESLESHGEFSVNFFKDGDNLHGELLIQRPENSSEESISRTVQVLGTTLPQLLLEIHYEVARSFGGKKPVVLPNVNTAPKASTPIQSNP